MNKAVTCPHNKIQIIHIITEHITKKVLDGALRHIFVATSSQDVLIQVSDGNVTLKED